jgi:hypothetical protein
MAKKIVIPPEIIAAVEAIEREITGGIGLDPPLIIEGGLPAEEAVPVRTIAYPGGMTWTRVVEADEDWRRFIERVALEADQRGGRIVSIGGMPPEPRDVDTDPIW